MALTAKGRARRALLLEAVIRVLEREGPVGITHRTVAAEAGVPLAAATYYFADLDDLLVSALTRAADEQVALFSRLSGAGVAGLAEALHSWAYASRGEAIAQYELLFLAMRRDSLRPAADLWYRSLENALSEAGLDPDHVLSASLALDGLFLRMLWRGEPSTVAGVETVLRGILQRGTDAAT